MKKNDESLSHIDFQEILTANGKQISASGKAVLLTSPLASPPPKEAKSEHVNAVNKQELMEQSENHTTTNNEPDEDSRNEFQVLTAHRPEKRKDPISLLEDDTPKKKAKNAPGNEYQKVYGRKLNEPRSSLSSPLSVTKSDSKKDEMLPSEGKQSLDTWENSNDYFSVHGSEEKQLEGEMVVRSTPKANPLPSSANKEENPSIFKFFNNWFQSKDDATSQELHSRTSNTQAAVSSLVMLANAEKTQHASNNHDSGSFHSVNNSMPNSPKRFIIKSPVTLAASKTSKGWDDDYEELIQTPDDPKSKLKLGGRLRKSGSSKSSKQEERFVASPPALGRVGRPD